jgi:hypothetical protein
MSGNVEIERLGLCQQGGEDKLEAYKIRWIVAKKV